MPALLALAIFLATSSAFAHGHWSWIMKHRNIQGVSCCDKTDVMPISHEQANAASVGSIISVDFPGESNVKITVLNIFQTEDKEGRAMITRYGCLFRHFGT